MVGPVGIGVVLVTLGGVGVALANQKVRDEIENQIQRVRGKKPCDIFDPQTGVSGRIFVDNELPCPDPGIPPGIIPPEEMALCEPQNNFEEVCIAATQQAQDDFNRFMMYKVFMQNITDREITFDLIGQFKNEDGTVQDLQARRQTIGAGKRSEFTFNFIWITGGLKEIDFFAWKSIDNPVPISLKAALNTLVKISG